MKKWESVQHHKDWIVNAVRIRMQTTGPDALQDPSAQSHLKWLIAAAHYSDMTKQPLPHISRLPSYGNQFPDGTNIRATSAASPRWHVKWRTRSWPMARWACYRVNIETLEAKLCGYVMPVGEVRAFPAENPGDKPGGEAWGWGVSRLTHDEHEQSLSACKRR